MYPELFCDYLKVLKVVVGIRHILIRINQHLYCKGCGFYLCIFNLVSPHFHQAGPTGQKQPLGEPSGILGWETVAATPLAWNNWWAHSCHLGVKSLGETYGFPWCPLHFSPCGANRSGISKEECRIGIEVKVSPYFWIPDHTCTAVTTQVLFSKLNWSSILGSPSD